MQTTRGDVEASWLVLAGISNKSECPPPQALAIWPGQKTALPRPEALPREERGFPLAHIHAGQGKAAMGERKRPDMTTVLF